MSQVPVLLDADLTQLLADSPEQIERSVLEMIVLDLYRRHEVSAGRGAELLNLDLLAFIRWAGAHGVPYIDMTPDEWEDELRAIEKA